MISCWSQLRDIDELCSKLSLHQKVMAVEFKVVDNVIYEITWVYSFSFNTNAQIIFE